MEAQNVFPDLGCMPAQKADCKGQCLTGGKFHGCIDPPPIPGQCSFPRQQAVHLCSLWHRCAVVNCARHRLDCQARGEDNQISHSFGDADVFIPRPKTPNVLANNISNVICYARLRRNPDEPRPVHRHSGNVQMLRCSSDGRCSVATASQHVVRSAERRLSQHAHRRHVYDADPKVHILFLPIEATRIAQNVDLVPLHGEQLAFDAKYKRHYFMADGLYIHKQFFPTKRDGFFIEVGGLNGVPDGSNSFFFERFLNWRGLMVEASPLNFAGLFTRRPLAYRLEAALGAKPQTLRFSGHGCCGKVAGGADSYSVQVLPIGSILQAMGVHCVDFWSLDVSRQRRTHRPQQKLKLADLLPPVWQVEGAELSVLEGMDWRIHVSVLLIESVNVSIRAFLQLQGFEHHRYRSPSRLNEIWVNKKRQCPTFSVPTTFARHGAQLLDQRRHAQ